MSATKRRSTVHDLASLRLHPDGSKVASAETNLQPRKGKYTTKDARGNWIAHDAGGTGQVKTRKKVRKDKEKKDTDEAGGGEETEAGFTVADKGKARVAEDGEEEEDDNDEYFPKDGRTKRRSTFQDDFSFLDSRDASIVGPEAGSVVAPRGEEVVSDSGYQLPLPSSVSSQIVISV